jgi:hypothetical protein
MRTANRLVAVPRGLAAPPSWYCIGYDDSVVGCRPPDDRSGATRQTTYVGSFPPFWYVVPGLAMRAGQSPIAALILGRLAGLLLAWLLVLAAVLALWEPGSPLSLLGILAAITVNGVATMATLNPSGVEIASAICVTACLIRLWRAGRGSAALWAALAVSGFALATSRPLGPLWVACQALVFLLAAGWGPLRRGRRAAPVATGAILAGCLLNLGWQLFAVSHVPISAGDVAAHLLPSRQVVIDIAIGLTGVPGWRDGAPLELLYLLGAALLFLPFTAAVFTVRGRELRLLDALALGVIIAALLVATLVEVSTGYGAVGRHVLPFAVMLPLYSGEVLHRHRRSLPPLAAGRLLIPACGLAALLQPAAWYATAHRHAVDGTGPWLFFGADSSWAPPAGWIPWLALLLVAVWFRLLAAYAESRVSLSSGSAK